MGPGLAQFGVRDFLTHPLLRVIRPPFVGGIRGGTINPAVVIAENANWNDPVPSAPAGYFSGRDKREMTQKLGTFPLAENSADSAVIVTVDSPVTVEVSGANGSAGIVLIEIYDITDL